jgi:putative PIN family toxin of toxin-antitoxin system
MRLVLDTNVLVSALLHPGRTPDLALHAVRAARAVVLVDERVEAEYREVLGRAKFRAIVPARREGLLAAVLAGCERVEVVAPSTVPLLDPDDRAFVEVALAGRADAVVTGNGRHYPETLGFAVLSPAALLARLTGV